MSLRHIEGQLYEVVFSKYHAFTNWNALLREIQIEREKRNIHSFDLVNLWTTKILWLIACLHTCTLTLLLISLSDNQIYSFKVVLKSNVLFLSLGV